MTRKSPIKHNVQPHVRSGVQVGRYERGKGTRPAKRRVGRPSALGGWRVTAYYDGASEAARVEAGNMTEALMAGLPRLRLPQQPRKIRVGRAKR